MPKLEYFLVAGSFSIDQSTNRISIFNILEELSGQLPTQLINNLVAVSAWNIRSDERERDFQVSLKIHLPGGKVLPEPGSEDFAVNFTAQRYRQRVVHEISGLPLPEAGDLRFEVLLNGAHQASHTVTVHAQEETA